MPKYDPAWETNSFDLTLNEAELRTIYGALFEYYWRMMEMKTSRKGIPLYKGFLESCSSVKMS